ncbi:unnamed protein product [Nesidiocoris tenuis]|uniref:Uncharacterized protein n=1 Tax=Nesidiocoris tenuis TaxID=355587 RepID=A0A6H5GMD8_9HEMI|nr:unnamed protein product [Nesidiocoris tenuis]
MEVLCVIYAPLVSMLTGRTICTPRKGQNTMNLGQKIFVSKYHWFQMEEALLEEAVDDVESGDLNLPVAGSESEKSTLNQYEKRKSDFFQLDENHCAILVRLQRKKSMTIQRAPAFLQRMRIPKNKNHHRNQRRLHQKRKLKVRPNIIFVK